MDIDYIRKTFRANETNNEPLYLQLANYFRAQLKANILVPGEKLPPEEDLYRALNISRTTIRQAINLLVEEGSFIRYRAKGTFVCKQKLIRKLNHLYNFSSDMELLGLSPSSIIYKHELVDVSSTLIQSRLELPDGHAMTFHLQRIRCADEIPILLEDTYIPYYLCPGVERYDFSNQSLYEILNQVYNLTPSSASETLQAIVIPHRERELLKCSANTVGYRINRIARSNANVIYELTTSLTRADICSYQFELNSSSSANAISSIVMKSPI